MNENNPQPTGGGMFVLGETSPESVFTPEDFSSEHKDIARAADDFVQGEIASLGPDIEVLNYDLSRRLMRKCGSLGFLGIDIPEKYGGMDLDKISSALVAERFGYGAGSFTITELNHTGIGTLPVALFGTEEQRKKYLPGLSTGELIGAFALTEPEAGSDALNPLSNATLSEDGKYYVLNGNKQFITNAGFADVVFTYAKVDGKFFTAFIVEQQWPGVSTDEEEEKMGWHGTSTRAYHFDNVKVPVENVLGRVGKGHVVALNALNMGRFKVGAICIGSAKRAFAEAVRYARQRVQFGRPICQFGMIRDKIAGMAIRVYAAESMMYRSAGLIEARSRILEPTVGDSGTAAAEALKDYLIECSINKVYGSETEGYVVDEEVQIFGGYGYIQGNHPEMAYRHARPNRIWEGTNEINRSVILNTLVRRVDEGVFDLNARWRTLSEQADGWEAVEVDVPDSLQAQEKLVQLAKKVFLFLFGVAYQEFDAGLREEQEILSLLSNMVMEVYAMETTFLRTQKMLARNSRSKQIPLKMTKVLFNDSIEKIGYLARELVQSLLEGEERKKFVRLLRKVMVSPPMNTVSLRREIAESMIPRGGYGF